MQKFYDDKNYKFVEPEDANNWIAKYVQGNITKDDLDDQRLKEMNGEDLF